MSWVTQPSVQVLFGFIDNSGARASSSVYMANTETDPTGGGPLALGDAMQSISGDALVTISCRVRASNSAPGDPTDGPYARGADKAKLGFRGADGSVANVQIGAPNETIFDSGYEDVDPDDSAMSNLIDQMKLYGKTAEGLAITGLQLGYRHRNKGRKGL